MPRKLEQVEQHQFRGRFLGQLADPAFGRVEAQLKRVERQHVADRDDQLTVEQEAIVLQRVEQFDDLGEIARQRLARLGGQRDLGAVAAREAAEAVPLGLELPAVAIGQFGGEQGFHRGQLRRAFGHSQTIPGRSQSFPLREARGQLR